MVAGEQVLAVVGALADAPQAGAGEGVVLVLENEVAVGDIDGDAVGAAAEGGIAGDATGAEGGQGGEIEARAVAGNKSDHGGFLCMKDGTRRRRAGKADVVKRRSGQEAGRPAAPGEEWPPAADRAARAGNIGS